MRNARLRWTMFALVAACGTSSDERAESGARDAHAFEAPSVDLHRSPGPVVIEEATNVAATVSPDQKTIILDLHGALFSVASTGGLAVRLTPDWLEPSRPAFSPRGDLIAFQAYAGGTFHIWVMHPDGSGLRQLTSGHGDDREPRVSPDGKRIAFASDRAFEGSYDIWIVDIATGELTRRTSSPAEEFEPAWSTSRGRQDEIAFVSGSGPYGSSIEAVDLPASGARSPEPHAAPASARRASRRTARSSLTSGSTGWRFRRRVA